MLLKNIVRSYVLNNQKCIRPVISVYLQVKHMVHQQQRTATSDSIADLVIENLSRKLCCSEDIAAKIYNDFPTLRQINAIKTDTLEVLRSNLSAKSIFENPSLLTTDIESLEKKINMLKSMQPKNLDDFAPLITLSEIKFKKLVGGLLKDKYKPEFHGHTNRIYYLSERLQVEPQVIARSIANGKCDITYTTFRNFEKKLRILMDYGANPMELASSVYVFTYDAEMLLRRSECVLSTEKPLKMWHFTLSQNNFDELIEKYKLERAGKGSALSAEMMLQIRKLTTEKKTIVDSLMSLLGGNHFESSQLYYSHVYDLNELVVAEENVNHLLEMKIDQVTMRKNGFLLTMPIDEIKEKIKIVQQMKPNNIADFIPLLIADAIVLENYKRDLIKLQAIGNDHPIYYFSSKLEIPVTEVAAGFAARSKVFLKILPNTLKPKLNVLLKHGVDRTTILSNSTVFKAYSVEKIVHKIKSLKKTGIDKISASMIHQLNSSQFDLQIERNLEEKKALDGFEDSMDYLSNRLGWSKVDLEDAMLKYPKLKQYSALKIKTHLDFWQNEVGLTAKEITHSLYVINKKLDEMKLRLHEMKINGAPLKLGMITGSETNYLNYIRSFCATEEDFSIIEARIKQKK
ncbi:uncharacterized protein LOC116352346 [Contarinia nasturtii]|uniref:uncharacterized protein LOC116352346 n=1 Tax=Contarinia nasturtii TaxID=265458 RepID=UPI0012D42D5B|nr:uncharacterized protein LOC116352346 [Contarinia nasturtii]